MKSEAEVIDLSLRQFQRRRELESLPAAECENLILDLSDAVYAANALLKCASYTWAESALILTVLSIVGNGEDCVSLFDKELAEVAGCSDRTVRRWRKAFSLKARGVDDKEVKRYSPMDITEGEYDRESQTHAPTVYKVVMTLTIERAVATARALPEYQTDRLAALKKAALLHYRELPDADYRARDKKPRRSMKASVPAHVSNALKNIQKAQVALGNLNESTRADLLDAQGEDLRRQLLDMHDKIAEMLDAMPQPVENKESKGGTGQNVRYPPDTGQEVWQRYESQLLKGDKAEHRNIRLIEHPPPEKVSWSWVKNCREELETMRKELSQDPELLEVYLAEADEYHRTGVMPKHRDARERALLLYLIVAKT